jgi:DNA repair protein RecO (recombination protein O)
LFAGRSSYNIISAEISNYFGELREDFTNLCYGFYFCEFADYLTKENNDEMNILKLLYQSLRALTKKSIDARLIRLIYELKSMVLNGQTPQVFACVKCENKNAKNKSAESMLQEERLQPDKLYFSAVCGGLLCEQCLAYDREAVNINASTLYNKLDHNIISPKRIKEV